MLNLVQIQDKLKDMPTRAIMAYANGQNPMVPPYLALGELNRRKQMEQSAMGEQARQGGEPPTIKQATEEQLGLMQLQKGRAMQAQQNMGQAMASAPSPVPAGVGEEPVQMAGGGLARLPVRNIHRQAYAGGGIVAFANNQDQPVNVDMPAELTDEEKKQLEENAYLRRSRAVKDFLSGLFPNQYELPGKVYKAIKQDINESPEDQAARFRSYSSRTEQAANPKEEVPAVKTASQRQEDIEAADTKANVGRSKIDYNRAEQLLKGDKSSSSSNGIATPRAVTAIQKPPVDVTADNFARFEKMLADRKLDVMPETNKGLEALRKQTEMYEKPVYSDWTEGLLGTVQDIRSGQAIGTSRARQEKENKQALADLNLKIATAEDLKVKAEYEFKRGNFDKAVEYDRKAQELANQATQAKAAMISANRPNSLESWVSLYKKDPEAALKYLGQSKAGAFTMEDALKAVNDDKMNIGLSDSEKVKKARELFNLMKQAESGASATMPREGDVAKSKSGKDIVFRNGNWEYK